MDETYQTYLNRVARLTLLSSHRTQLENVQQSPKYQGKQVQPFPGYTVTTAPAREDPANTEFYDHLAAKQQELLAQIDSEFIVSVPPSSFHLTLADLIWDSSYRDAVASDPQFEIRLREGIKGSFATYQHPAKGSPLTLQILGLMVRPRAVALALAPQAESDYQRILELRRAIYQNADLVALGIEQQYPFNAHVTLGYFDSIPPHLDREQLANTFDKLNEQWLETEPPVLRVQQAELRNFEDMSYYRRQPDFPILEL